MTKTLSKKAFIQHMARATKDAGYTVEKTAGERLHVVLNGQTNRLKMTMAFNAYKNAPDKLDAIVDAHLNVLRSLGQVTPPTLEGTGLVAGDGGQLSVKADQLLVPVLQQKSWLAEMTEQIQSTPVNRPFVTGLIITYVIDTPAFRTYLSENMLANIVNEGIATADEVHEDALGNLRTLVDNEMQIDTFHSFSETIITCETQEGYASSCILLPDLMEEWDRKISGDMLIGIPNRDFIIAFSHKHPAGIEGLEKQIAKDARSRPRPLSGRLLKWADGQAREFRPLN